MDHPLIARRELVAWAALAAAAATLRHHKAAALGRIPLEGKIAMTLPWPVDRIDPHDLADSGAALFGQALFDELYALGPVSAVAARSFGERGRHFESVEALARAVAAAAGADVTILVKGSRFMRMERVVEALGVAPEKAAKGGA